jgi:hypothetical protein
MLVSSSRPTASRFRRGLGSATVLCITLLGLSAVPALATGSSPATPAGCEGQTFSQPFTTENDFNYYTLVPGGEFNSASEGWTLSRGAQIVQTTRPNAATGGVLNLPSGARAVSPPVCVTLQYPTARIWVRNVRGSEGVTVAVAYAGTPSATNPKTVGQVHGQQSNWTLSEPFNLQPQTAGSGEGPREVRFVFVAGGLISDFQLSGLWVDPRMR